MTAVPHPAPRDLLAEALVARFEDGGGQPVAALDGVSARFASGRMTAVTGPSGCGKTSLLHALAGILQPQAGEVRFGEVRVTGLAERARDAWRLAHCGLVFQDFRLVDELDALSNVLLPSQFRRSAGGADLRQRARELLHRFDLTMRSGPVSRLSRGEQQRVALARALLLDPPIILADEPTASLDRGNAHRIGAALHAIAQSGKTVVVVTHDGELAARADGVLTMDAGRITSAAAATATATGTGTATTAATTTTPQAQGVTA